MTTYIEQARSAFLASSAHRDTWDPDANPALTDLYVLLVLTRGTACTNEDIHHAWSASVYRHRPGHRSLVPYEELPANVQGYDTPFRDAVRNAAATLIGVAS